MSKWNKEKENLEDMILNQKLSYEEIGRKYGCSGSNIKKVALRLGIDIIQRRKINSKETFNKGKNTHFCEYCGKKLSYNKKYCNNICSSNAIKQKTINSFEQGQLSISPMSDLPGSVKTYLFESVNYKCSCCNFEGYNRATGKTILQIHHIDGNSGNNLKNNLQVLCPNCHAMTENYMALNKGKSARIKRYHNL